MKTTTAILAVLALSSSLALADEGMWMPQQIPMLADELRELGLQIDPESFDDLTKFPMGAIVSLGGCSGAFVSDEGLILTNHHCVNGSLQYNSTSERDLLNDGFLARSKDEELWASPTARVYVTTGIEDVTEDILGGLMGDDVSDYDRAKGIEDRRKQMIKVCEEVGDVRCWVRSFFGGETFLKITAKVLKDVRLVYAPDRGVGNFGGEVDNWMWPRHTGDFAYYRAYVGPDGEPAEFSPDNVPYRPEHHLKISTRDLDPEDLVLLAGYPGRTSRLVTSEEVRDAQDVTMPLGVRYRDELSTILTDQGKDDRDVQIRNASRIRGLDNYKKKYTGVLEAFERDGILERKLAQEGRLERHFEDNSTGAADYTAARKEFLHILEGERSTRDRNRAFRWMYSASPLLSQANRLYRMSLERPKPDDEREEGYQERDWPRIESGIRRTQRSIDVGSDRAGLHWALLNALSLPADQRIEAIDEALAATGGESPESQIERLLDQLYSETKLTELDTRLAMLEQDTEQLLSHEDPFLDLARSLRPLGKEIEDAGRAGQGARYRLRPRLIKALRDMNGGRLAPDANGTLRVAFGVVRGYEARDAVFYAPHTTVHGILQKNTGEEPFDSPATLLEQARAQRFGPYADPDLDTLPVAFLSTVNVTNGSSGSCALNAWGEIIGLAFDMNWEGVAADWVVNEDVVRTINVDSRYMLWVMDAVDGAHNLLEEMGLPVRFPERPGR